MTSENTAQDTSSTFTVLSDEEIVTQFCPANKVSKTAMEELIKCGFTSLEALKLVENSERSAPTDYVHNSLIVTSRCFRRVQ